ncbi:uncharacterized protein BO97DRAFT_266936 [Aspergillus homomorphus CBS 101889]|uniref:Uncharacterized protein n=1 Tax=Aspergillus homomorphus (strain CBS 101889) TaxID=1450537 RepID=A0A395HHW2_ASPHC|nr:hypothetical protein BO97DRAFT_266936 [Aspergillus homomorphus CBS 101889]RAL07093.1 hypothetical protein BO97DRAFT_266936 [Aspergillus homomorphus CBS 101889]
MFVKSFPFSLLFLSWTLAYQEWAVWAWLGRDSLMNREVRHDIFGFVFFGLTFDFCFLCIFRFLFVDILFICLVFIVRYDSIFARHK